MGTVFTVLIVGGIGYYTFRQIKKTVDATKKGSCVGCDCSSGKCSIKN
jgi:hypothetical protein